MKGLFFLTITLVFISLTSCAKLQAPIYKGVDHVNISSIVNDSITIHADINFNNPNKIGGQLFLNRLQAKVNTVEIKNIKDKKVAVPAKTDFSVPLDLKLSYQEVFDAKKGVLGALLNSILTNEVKVELDGFATFKKFIIKKEYPIHYIKSIKIIK